MWTALIVLLAEVALTRWIAAQRQVSAADYVDFEFESQQASSFAVGGDRLSSGLSSRSASSSAAKEVVST